MSGVAGTILYQARLRPNPAMPCRVLLAVVCIVAAIDIGFATLFLLRGAWPITPFMGADIALFAWALFASRRAARRHEDVCLTPRVLSVERYVSGAQPSRIELNPYWVQVELREPVESGTSVVLRSHGRAVPIGNFLPPVQKRSVAQALRAALQRAREPQMG